MERHIVYGAGLRIDFSSSKLSTAQECRQLCVVGRMHIQLSLRMAGSRQNGTGGNGLSSVLINYVSNGSAIVIVNNWVSRK